jgi:hypothetical protein
VFASQEIPEMGMIPMQSVTERTQTQVHTKLRKPSVFAARVETLIVMKQWLGY